MVTGCAGFIGSHLVQANLDAGHIVLATQRPPEAARSARPGRVVYASSSSVYGNAAAYPTRESDLPRPHSPHGVTKLAAEHLCGLYAANWSVPTVSLRYFTVYGPRQPPDLGSHRLIGAALAGRALPLFGDGEQVRDFTYVGDVVGANLAACSADLEPGESGCPSRLVTYARPAARSTARTLSSGGRRSCRWPTAWRRSTRGRRVRRPRESGRAGRAGGSS